MSTISCMAGATKIARVLRHIRTEHEREKVSAAIFIGDAWRSRRQLYLAAAGLGVPVFWFQEGDGLVMPLDHPVAIGGARRRRSSMSFASSRG